MSRRGRNKNRLGIKSTRLKELGYKTYPQYLAGIEWRKTRIRFLNSDYVTRIDGVLVCSDCKALETKLKHPLHVHHLTYENLGNENMSDLRLLCEDCHAIIHKRKKPLIPAPSLRKKSEVLVINTLKPAPNHLRPGSEPRHIDPRRLAKQARRRKDREEAFHYLATDLFVGFMLLYRAGLPELYKKHHPHHPLPK